MSKLIIGVDPDVERNGVAYLIKHTKEECQSDSFYVDNLSFFELFDVLKLKKDQGILHKAVIEAGWLNKSNWHIKPSDSKYVAAEKGNSVGRNHEVGRKIAEMCEHLGISYELVRPLPKRGKKGKPNAEYFYNLTKITVKGKFAQEMIDAGLLIFGR